jgi:hypothetical protein
MIRRQNKSPEKFTAYFNIVDAFKQPGCAICRLLQKAVHTYLDSLFYEHVNDAGTRRRLRQSFGFCREHAQTAISMRDAFGLAIIYDDILGQVAASLGERKLPEAIQECPLCTTRSTFEKQYVEVFRQYLTDPDFQEAFSLSSGLCLPHFRLASEHLKGTSSAFLFSTQEHIVKQSMHHLKEFIRKHDYRFSDEGFSEAEASSWKFAVHLIAGE